MDAFFFLSRGIERQVAVAGDLRRNLRLLEVDDIVMDEIVTRGACIKGRPDEEAVLCTAAVTYDLKHVETTNALLLVAPQRVRNLRAHAFVPFLSPSITDTGAKIVVTARTDHQLECTRVGPRLHALDEMLQAAVYGEEDEDAAAAPGENDGACDMLESDADLARHRPPGHTFEELSQQVQASNEELRQALAARHALCLHGRWRAVDPPYLGHVLELLLLTALERGWPRDALDGAEAAAALRAEGNVDPRVVLHCLSVFGRPVKRLQHDDSDGGNVWELEEAKVCSHFGMMLLREQSKWLISDFMARWRADVPEGMTPELSLLNGEVLVDGAQLEAFSAASLPMRPEERFAALFAHRQQWAADDLKPYIASLEAPGQSTESLLLRFTRVTQPHAASTIMYSAR